MALLHDASGVESDEADVRTWCTHQCPASAWETPTKVDEFQIEVIPW